MKKRFNVVLGETPGYPAPNKLNSALAREKKAYKMEPLMKWF